MTGSETQQVTAEETISTLGMLLADANKDAGALNTGACIVQLPSSTKCFMVTPQQCAQMKGSYVGGNCP